MNHIVLTVIFSAMTLAMARPQYGGVEGGAGIEGPGNVPRQEGE
jgi:hypothetical protein